MESRAQLSVEQKVLLAALGRGRGDPDTAGWVMLLPQVKWERFLAIASQDLYPYLASMLEPHIACLGPPPEWELFAAARRRAAVHNLRLRHELGKVIEVLGEAGIPSLALKGIVLANTVYPDPSLRPMSDLDILVPPGKREEALLVLRKIGFGYSEEALAAMAVPRDQFCRSAPEQESAPPLQLRGSTVLLEVHSQLECSEPVLPIPMQEFWSRSTAADLNGLRVRTLCPEDFLFHLCMHQSRSHRFEKGLLPLLDIRMLLEIHADWNWVGIAARSLRSKCAIWLYLTLKAARDLVAARVPHMFFETLPQPRDLPTLQRLVEEQIMSAHSGRPVPLLITALLAEHSWRRRARMVVTRTKIAGREEIGPRANLPGLIRGARIYCRRLLATLQVRIPRYFRAWKRGGLKVGAIRRSTRLLRHSNALFDLVEIETEAQNQTSQSGP